MACCSDCADTSNNMNALKRYGFGRSQGDTDFECPSGWIMNANNECVPPRQSPQCPSGMVFDSDSGNCVNLTPPIFDTSTNPIYGQKTKLPLADTSCNNYNAPQGYHVIKTANGCALAVNYDSNIVGNVTTSANPLSNLINTLTGNTSTGGNTGEMSSGLSGLMDNKLLLAAVVLGGLYFVSKGGKKQPKTYDRTESYKY